MTDLKSQPDTMPNPLFLREEELNQAMELLFFAYRDFTAGRTRFWPSMVSGAPTIG